jgi:CRISPR type III-A-associated protein Csm2
MAKDFYKKGYEKSSILEQLEARNADILNYSECTDLETLIDLIESYVKERKSAITTSQLRNIFQKVKEAQSRLQLQMIRPLLAYVAARQKSEEAKEIVKFLSDLINQVKDDAKQLQNFQYFMEAIVAYHKFYNPKEN